MKKIFWTVIVMSLLVFLFWSYVRLFNKPLAVQVATWFAKCEQTCLTTGGIVNTDVTDQLDVIKTQLDVINQKLESQSISTTEDALFATTTSTKVGLYYFNQLADEKLAPEQQININSVLHVYRNFPATNNLLLDTIKELIKGDLTAEEIKKWFTTEFPNSKFDVAGLELTPDGVLTIEFTEVPGFTDGGSARMLILSNTIEKTALQFPGVKKVIFLPETIFQP